MFPSFARLGAAIWGLILAGVIAAAPAQKAPSSSSRAPQFSGGKHCLWRVTDAKAPFYLLGSIHSLRKKDYPLPPVIEQTIQESQQFYLEYDPQGDDELERKLTAAAALPKGVIIKQKIKPQTWNFLLAISDRKNYSSAGLRAWAIAKFVLDYSAYERPSGAYGIDNYVISRARMRKRPMRGLETIDEHVNVYAGMSDIESEAYLLEAIAGAHQHDVRFREMVKDWRQGETERLYRLEMPGMSEAPGLVPRFIQRRNVRWIPKIEEAIKSGKPTMIVAGAMHFAGPGNILNLLRARGHTIEQL